uniref:Uncharacterized protein n=1 Tax=Kapraunia schneideri TaxID=717899 RepID=A0A1Z1MRV5_9FLOR|nr:hypothetical protein [Kapraunia schneideri]ARW68818.1 hypothetical protein [Kapraunia schneideri]
MINYNSLFYLYLVVVCLLLFFFAFFVSLQLKFIFFHLLKYLNVFNIFNENFFLLDKDYENFYFCYLNFSNYLLCIFLSECYLDSNISLLHKKLIYTNLGYLYSELLFWEISEYYYLQALSINIDNYKFNIPLQDMYYMLGYQENI